jgi:hypothetical protein
LSVPDEGCSRKTSSAPLISTFLFVKMNSDTVAVSYKCMILFTYIHCLYCLMSNLKLHLSFFRHECVYNYVSNLEITGILTVPTDKRNIYLVFSEYFVCTIRVIFHLTITLSCLSIYGFQRFHCTSLIYSSYFYERVIYL